MRAGAGFVVEGRSDMSWFWAFVDDDHGFFASCDGLFWYSLDVYTFSGVFSKLEVVIGLVEEIDDLFVVDLEKRALDVEDNAYLSLFINAFKKILHGSRD